MIPAAFGITGMIGAGVGVAAVESPPLSADSPIVVGAIDALLAYRVTPDLALGLRFGIAGVEHSYNVRLGSQYDTEDYDFTTLPVDLGFAVRYEHRRLWIAPWVGAHASAGTLDHTGYSLGMPVDEHSNYFSIDFPVVGITGGVDVVELGGHELGCYLDLRSGLGREESNDWEDPPMTNWRALTVGIAFAP